MLHPQAKVAEKSVPKPNMEARLSEISGAGIKEALQEIKKETADTPTRNLAEKALENLQAVVKYQFARFSMALNESDGTPRKSFQNENLLPLFLEQDPNMAFISENGISLVEVNSATKHGLDPSIEHLEKFEVMLVEKLGLKEQEKQPIAYAIWFKRNRAKKVLADIRDGEKASLKLYIPREMMGDLINNRTASSKTTQ